MQHAPDSQSLLGIFCQVRLALPESRFVESARHIIGKIELTDAVLPSVQTLVDEDQAEVRISTNNISYLSDIAGQTVEITLKIVHLSYYENANDLLRFTSREPDRYYVHGIGIIEKNNRESPSEIIAYRDTLRVREFLRSLADYDDQSKVTFLVPEKLEIKLICHSLSFEPLHNIAELSTHFDKNSNADAADREQRLVLFRRVLKEYLKTHPWDLRLDMFMANFALIYESYARDYQLWVGNSFGELEKAFEEKRLKFIADLNGILSGVQTSILAVPIAAILLGDKFDFAVPLKNFFLAAAVSTMAAVALKLLNNQEVTLDATRKAINATKSDFEKKHNKRKVEFTTRLQNLDDQESRVRCLLRSLKSIIRGIALLSILAWIFSASWPLLKQYDPTVDVATPHAPTSTANPPTGSEENEGAQINTIQKPTLEVDKDDKPGD